MTYPPIDDTQDAQPLRDAEAIAAYARIADFMRASPLGCCAHIVLHDGNVDNAHVQFCQQYARTQRHTDCVVITDLLARMSRTQRIKAHHQF